MRGYDGTSANIRASSSSDGLRRLTGCGTMISREMASISFCWRESSSVYSPSRSSPVASPVASSPSSSLSSSLSSAPSSSSAAAEPPKSFGTARMLLGCLLGGSACASPSVSAVSSEARFFVLLGVGCSSASVMRSRGAGAMGDDTWPMQRASTRTSAIAALHRPTARLIGGGGGWQAGGWLRTRASPTRHHGKQRARAAGSGGAQGMHRDGRPSARRRWAAWGKLGAIGGGLEVGHRSLKAAVRGQG